MMILIQCNEIKWLMPVIFVNYMNFCRSYIKSEDR